MTLILTGTCCCVPDGDDGAGGHGHGDETIWVPVQVPEVMAMIP